jgi:uncharacterized repeat protein (TIGR01451 family)
MTMVLKHFTLGILVLGLLGFGTAGFADEEPPKEKSFFQRMDDFGKSIFGGSRSDDSSDASVKDREKSEANGKSDAQNSTRKKMPNTNGESTKDSSRAGSAFSGNDATSSSATSPSSRSTTEDTLQDRKTSQDRKRSYTTSQDNSKSQESSKSSSSPLQERQGIDYRMSNSAVSSQYDTKNSKPSYQHVDIAAIQSNDTTPSTSQAAASAASKNAVGNSTQTKEILAPLSESPSESATASKTTTRPLHERLSGFRQSAFPAAEQSEAAPTVSAGSDVASEGVKVASRPQDSERLAAKTQNNDETPVAPTIDTPMVSPDPVAGKTKSDDLVLFARKGPVLGVETMGPRKISVGKESVFEVSLNNTGEVAAEELVVFVSVPAWAEVQSTEPTVGTAQTMPATATDGMGVVQWHVGHMNAKGQERLALRLIPRQSKPFDLAVRWEYKPIASQAMIEVQEPKLTLQLEGPREVLYGQKESYRLKLNNTGTGNADNVAIMLMPLGAGENVAASHKLGTLKAGEEKTLDVELTARQAGNLTIQVDVRADGGVHTEASEEVLVRRAALKIDIDGPKIQFLGQQAAFTIHVRNTGTAIAKNIQLSSVLPTGAKYVSGVEKANLDSKGNKVDWTLDKLAPEMEQTYTLHCNLNSTGANRLEVSASGDDDLNAIAAVNTRVESVANLVMNVVDPSGPIAVGDSAPYEIHVRNRGTKVADNVEVFVYFSRGIEPVAAEGAPNRMMPGQVVFLPIASIEPGAEIVLKVQGKAEIAGNHVFRAEAHCKPLGARLISEATNLYYTDSSNGQQQVAQESGANGTVAASREHKNEAVGGAEQAVEDDHHASQAEVTPNIPRK